MVDGRDFLDDLVPGPGGSIIGVRRLEARLVEDPVFQRSYPAEAAVQRGLDAPTVAVPISCLNDDQGRVVGVVRRQVPGQSLAALLDSFPAGMDAQTVTAVAMDVLAALSALHAIGTAHHADLASRLIVDESGRCVLVDVGLAPRTPNYALELAIADDLDAFADLVTNRLTGTAGVPQPIRSVVGGHQGVAAAVLLEALGPAAAATFDADWDARARERLAALARTPGAVPPIARPPHIDAPVGPPNRRGPVILFATALAAAMGLGIYLGVAPSHPAAKPVADPTTTPAPQSPTPLPSISVSPIPTPTPTPSATTTTPTPTPTHTTPSATPTTPSTPPYVPTSYEAEAASRDGGARTGWCSACSGGRKVRFVGEGGTLTFDVTEPSNGVRTLTIYYIDGDVDRTAVMTVNGVDTVLDFHGTNDNDWENVQTLVTTVSLNAGDNTIEFGNPVANAPDFDRIVV